MSRKYKFKDPDEMHFVTHTLINWIDGDDATFPILGTSGSGLVAKNH